MFLRNGKGTKNGEKVRFVTTGRTKVKGSNGALGVISALEKQTFVVRESGLEFVAQGGAQLREKVAHISDTDSTL